MHMLIIPPNMSTFSHFLLFLILCSAVSASAAAEPQPQQLAQKVCNQTSNYSFCVDALYSDPRAPDADETVLAYISFGLAYANATATQRRISELIKNATADGRLVRDLRSCAGYYADAVNKLVEAYSDLDSETYYFLGEEAAKASRSAADCEASFLGIASPLTEMNGFLMGLCEICIVVFKLFNSS